MIEGIAAIAPTTARGTARAGGTGFRLKLDEPHEGAAPAAPLALAAMPTLLAFQEAESADAQDRTARQAGRDMLAELRRLQLGLLSPGGLAASDLARLARLTDALPYTADPGLRGTLAAIALRAKIELARRAGR